MNPEMRQPSAEPEMPPPLPPSESQAEAAPQELETLPLNPFEGVTDDEIGEILEALSPAKATADKAAESGDEEIELSADDIEFVKENAGDEAIELQDGDFEFIDEDEAETIELQESDLEFVSDLNEQLDDLQDKYEAEKAEQKSDVELILGELKEIAEQKKAELAASNEASPSKDVVAVLQEISEMAASHQEKQEAKAAEKPKSDIELALEDLKRMGQEQAAKWKAMTPEQQKSETAAVQERLDAKAEAERRANMSEVEQSMDDLKKMEAERVAKEEAEQAAAAAQAEARAETGTGMMTGEQSKAHFEREAKAQAKAQARAQRIAAMADRVDRSMAMEDAKEARQAKAQEKKDGLAAAAAMAEDRFFSRGEQIDAAHLVGERPPDFDIKADGRVEWLEDVNLPRESLDALLERNEIPDNVRQAVEKDLRDSEAISNTAEHGYQMFDRSGNLIHQELGWRDLEKKLSVEHGFHPDLQKFGRMDRLKLGLKSVFSRKFRKTLRAYENQVIKYNEANEMANDSKLMLENPQGYVKAMESRMVRIMGAKAAMAARRKSGSPGAIKPPSA